MVGLGFNLASASEQSGYRLPKNHKAQHRTDAPHEQSENEWHARSRLLLIVGFLVQLLLTFP